MRYTCAYLASIFGTDKWHINKQTLINSINDRILKVNLGALNNQFRQLVVSVWTISLRIFINNSKESFYLQGRSSKYKLLKAKKNPNLWKNFTDGPSGRKNVYHTHVKLQLTNEENFRVVLQSQRQSVLQSLTYRILATICSNLLTTMYFKRLINFEKSSKISRGIFGNFFTLN